MSKRPATLIVLDRNKRESLQTQLAVSLKELVQARVLAPGEAVPSSRDLARDLHVSRNTVVQAYDRLIGEGYLEPSARRGLFVSESLANRSVQRTATAAPKSPVQRSSERAGAPPPFRPCQPDV